MRGFAVMAASGLRVAPVWRRLAAGSIDSAILLIPTLAAAGAWTAFLRWRGRNVEFPHFGEGWQRTIDALSAPIQVEARNWRSPGYRALGLRRVDAGTGGPVTLRGSITQSAARAVWNGMTRSVMRPWQARQLERLKAVQARAREVTAAHADDHEAMDRAVMEIYQREDLNPLRGCLPALAVGLVPHLTAFWSPLNQTLFEHLAGTVVVLEG